MRFARHSQILQAAREDQTTTGGEWKPDDRIDLGPDAEPIDPATWPTWTDADHWGIATDAPEPSATESGPTRRSFVGGVLALLGVGAGPVAVAATRVAPGASAFPGVCRRNYYPVGSQIVAVDLAVRTQTEWNKFSATDREDWSPPIEVAGLVASTRLLRSSEPPQSTPLGDAYRLWLDTLDTTTQWYASSGHKLSSPDHAVSRQAEQEFGALDAAETDANIELVHRILEASGVDPETILPCYGPHVERHAEPFAVCREGSRVFALVLVQGGTMGAVNVAEIDDQHAVRPVVIDLGGVQS